MTELEAVNSMLAAIGEAPFNSLDADTTSETQFARNLLRDKSREVQTSGWYFNTERDYELLRDVNTGEINIPPDFIHVDLETYQGDIEVVRRGSRLYDLKNHTYVFDRDLKARIVRFLPWDELPGEAHVFIAALAAREFQQQELGEATTDTFKREDVAHAQRLMRRRQSRQSDRNAFRQWDVFRAVSNRIPRRGRVRLW